MKTVKEIHSTCVQIFVLHNTDTISFPFFSSCFLRYNKQRYYWSVILVWETWKREKTEDHRWTPFERKTITDGHHLKDLNSHIHVPQTELRSQSRWIFEIHDQDQKNRPQEVKRWQTKTVVLRLSQTELKHHTSVVEQITYSVTDRSPEHKLIGFTQTIGIVTTLLILVHVDLSNFELLLFLLLSCLLFTFSLVLIQNSSYKIWNGLGTTREP